MSPSLPFRWPVLAVLAVVLSLLAGPSLGAAPRPAYALTNCDVAGLSIDSEEQAFLALINAHRATAGAPALVITQPLNRAATWLSVDMSAKNYFAHNDLLGRDPFTRMNECDVPGWDNAGENIAAGHATAQAAFDSWRNSAEHNANMLRSSFRGIGIARAFRQGSTYGWYWTTTFSAVADGALPPAPGAPNAPPAACSAVSLASNQGPAVAPNTAVLLTATATCPANAAHQWWGAFVAANGAQSWQQLTAYGAARSYTWTPTAPGNYILGVWAKADGSAPAGGFDASTTVNITVAAPGPAPCTGATLTPPPGTAKIGQVVRFTANATCAGAAQYQWWGAIVLGDGSQTWQPLTQFGASRTYDWTPTGPGTYLIGAWAKNQGSTPAGGFETSATNQFVVSP